MKTRVKNLGLAGAFLGSSILYGCTPFQLASLYNQERLANATHRQADAMERNGPGRQNIEVTGNPRLVKSNKPQWDVFSCTSCSDLDNDGFIDRRAYPEGDVLDKNKKEFYTGDSVVYGVWIENCQGKILEFFGQEVQGENPKKLFSIPIDRPNFIYWLKSSPYNNPSDWHSYWMLSGADKTRIKIGESRISVKQDPARTVN
jgi:hypothetical protein